MAQMLMGKKRGMTRLFDEKGREVVVTVIEVEPNVVLDIKTSERDGYTALQQGFEKINVKDQKTLVNRVRKPQLKIFEKKEIAPRRYIRESRIENVDNFEIGQELTVALFENTSHLDVTGVSIGKGYQGGMKLHNFRGGRASHGNSKAHRSIGSTGMRSTPGRCLPGGKRASHMGARQQTTQNLQIVKVDTNDNLILVKGAVPGADNSLVCLKEAVKKQKNK